MSTLTQFLGNSHQMLRGQLSPLSATAPVARRGCGPDTAGRPVMLDPCTGQSVCCSPMDNRSATLLHPPTSAASHRGLSAVMYGAAEKNYVHYAADSPMFYSNTMANGRTVCYPYELSPAQFSYYGESCGYGVDLNGVRRKNTTRETTSTLKAWLYEHRKNPYPTKGEKIMLAIITKMTLTQVSTWFANARRRLKKENKMTWSPRNRCGDGGKEDYESEDGEDHDRDDDMDGLGTDLESNHSEKLSDVDDRIPADWDVGDLAKILPGDRSQAPVSEPRVPVGFFTNSGRDSVSVTVDEEGSAARSREHCSPLSCRRRSPSPAPLAPSMVIPTCRPTSRSPLCEKVPPRQAEKPKIWSLAETALSKSPERRPQRPSHNLNLADLQSRYKPYNSPVNTPGLAMERLMAVQAPHYKTSFVNETQAGQTTISLPPFISGGFTAGFQRAASSPQLHHEKAAMINAT